MLPSYRSDRASVGDTFGALLGVSDFAVELCGEPSAALLTATEGLDVAAYGYLQGI